MDNIAYPLKVRNGIHFLLIKKELLKITDKENLRPEPKLVMTIPDFLLLNYARR